MGLPGFRSGCWRLFFRKVDRRAGVLEGVVRLLLPVLLLVPMVAVTVVGSGVPQASAQSCRYEQSFDGFADGTTDLGDGSVMAGGARIVGGKLELSRAGVGSVVSSFSLPAPAGSAAGWSASFAVTIQDRLDASDPADGLSLNYGNAALGELGSGEEGMEGVAAVTENLSFEIDTYANVPGEHGYAIAEKIAGSNRDVFIRSEALLGDGGTITGVAEAWFTPTPERVALWTVVFPNSAPTSGPIATSLVGADGFTFNLSARTGGLHQTVLVDDLVIECRLARCSINGWPVFSASALTQKNCDALVALYQTTGGSGWSTNTGWKAIDGIGLGDPCDWYGVTCDATGIVDLDLAQNGLSGSIPAEIGNLTSLTRLSLASNQLAGSIPAEIGDLTNLKILWLDTNRLAGSIPAEIGDLTNLTGLALSVNSLSGSIPAEIGGLTNLRSLALERNGLSGAVPASIRNLTNLTEYFGLLPNGCLSADAATTAFLDGFGHGAGLGAGCRVCNGKLVTIDMNLNGGNGTGTAAADVILGTPNADAISGGGGGDTICGGDGNDTINGDEGPDVIFGDLGDDTILGGVGWDTLDGSRGNDMVFGGPGNDVMFGGWGDDEVFGEEGDDLILGFGGADELWGGPGKDRINGQNDTDYLDGGTEADQLWGAFGDDVLNGGDGWDLLFGGWGADTLYGGGGNDTLYGEANDDALWGGPGNDNLQGGWSNDTLDGGANFDICNGDIGFDTATACENISGVP